MQNEQNGRVIRLGKNDVSESDRALHAFQINGLRGAVRFSYVTEGILNPDQFHRTIKYHI